MIVCFPNQEIYSDFIAYFPGRWGGGLHMLPLPPRTINFASCNIIFYTRSSELFKLVVDVPMDI